MSNESGTSQAERNDRWSQKIWREWTEKYNQDNPLSPCPDDILQTASTPADLQPWLIKFITSFQEGQGTAYRPKTLYALLCHIHRHVKIYNPHYKSLRFLDRKNEEFKDFRDSLSRVNQHMEEFGIERRHYDVFTEEDEEILWSKKVLGAESSVQLLHTVYFYNGKNLLLRRGEHQQLRLSQFRRLRSPDCYEFERIHVSESSSDQEGEGLSPSASGPRKSQRRKVTHIMADSSAGEKCHVFLLDAYFNKIPPGSLKNDHFYLQPIKSHPTHQLWYTERAYGKNSLDKIAKCIAESGGLSGHYTATSLQQTGRINTSSKITHSYKSNGKQNSLSPPVSKKRKVNNNNSFEGGPAQVLQSMIRTCYSREVPSTFAERPNSSSLQFSGEFLFSNAKVSVLVEGKDSKSSQSGFQEMYMGDCSLSIKPSAPIDLNLMATLQGLEQGHWQVVMIPPKKSEERSQETEDETVSDVYSSEEEDDSVYRCPSPESYSLPPGTTIFQYVNN